MRLERINGPRVEEYLKRSQTVLIPVGSLENHGRHMPLGTDTLIPERITELVEERCEILVAPTIPYGATDSLYGFPGTVTIGTDGLIMLLSRVTDSLYRYGFRRFVILNGHGGNNAAIEQVGRNLYKKGALLACLNWWKMAGELDPAWAGGHGGAEETAGVMGVDPALIDQRFIEDGMELKDDISPEMPSTGWSTVLFRGATVVIPREARHYFGNGWYGEDKPPLATEEWGREMLQAMADYTAEFCGAFAAAQLPEEEA